jgi:hypothetical protein
MKYAYLWLLGVPVPVLIALTLFLTTDAGLAGR